MFWTHTCTGWVKEDTKRIYKMEKDTIRGRGRKKRRWNEGGKAVVKSERRAGDRR